MNKEDVAIKIYAWEGAIDTVQDLEDVWVRIPFKWSTLLVIDQIAKCFGNLEEVDWVEIFKRFYEVIRIKLAVKDISKIPEERLFGMMKKLYLLYIIVEDEPNRGRRWWQTRRR